MARARKMTAEIKQEFLRHLLETANVSEAAARLKITRSRFYEQRQKDPAFCQAWAEAVGATTDRLEAEAIRRAVDGVEEPYFYQGRECGRVRKYSDPLMKFLLQHRLPERYGDGEEGADQSPVVFEMHFAPQEEENGEDGHE